MVPMDIIGHYYAQPLISKKNRVRSKDKTENTKNTSWGEQDMADDALSAMEARLNEIRMRKLADRRNTPVFRAKQADISSWIGTVATEQDRGSRSDRAFQTYSRMSKLPQGE